MSGRIKGLYPGYFFQYLAMVHGHITVLDTISGPDDAFTQAAFGVWSWRRI